MAGNTLWVDSLLDFDIASGGQGVANLAGTITFNEQRMGGMTLMRTIVGIDLAYTVHDSGEGSQMVDLGIAFASREAAQAAVLPDPSTVTDFPPRGWVFRYRCRLFGFAADQPAVFTRRVDRDIRARRKMDNGEAVIIIDNTAIEGVATAIRITGLIRMLYLLS